MKETNHTTTPMAIMDILRDNPELATINNLFQPKFIDQEFLPVLFAEGETIETFHDEMINSVPQYGDEKEIGRHVKSLFRYGEKLYNLYLFYPARTMSSSADYRSVADTSKELYPPQLRSITLITLEK
jgi:hypothetical protein